MLDRKRIVRIRLILAVGGIMVTADGVGSVLRLTPMISGLIWRGFFGPSAALY